MKTLISIGNQTIPTEFNVSTIKQQFIFAEYWWISGLIPEDKDLLQLKKVEKQNAFGLVYLENQLINVLIMTEDDKVKIGSNSN